MATVYEIIQGINQAAANGAWDGAHSADLAADGKARDAGLKRANGHFINDRRVIDGFGVKFHGPILRITYQSEIRIKEVQDKGFEGEIENQIQEIVKFLKKDGQQAGDLTRKNNMATVYEIIQGINQAAANGAWDGAHSADLAADGKARDAGLKRANGHFINDRRVIDGFGVKFHGPILRVTYQSEIRIKEVQDKGFEGEIESQIQEIVKFLKKEYKAITGNTLTLTKEGEPSILVQRMSNYRTDVQAHCDYRIGGLTDVGEVSGKTDEERLDSSIRDFLSMGRDKAKKPSNVKI